MADRITKVQFDRNLKPSYHPDLPASYKAAGTIELGHPYKRDGDTFTPCQWDELRADLAVAGSVVVWCCVSTRGGLADVPGTELLDRNLPARPEPEPERRPATPAARNRLTAAIKAFMAASGGQEIEEHLRTHEDLPDELRDELVELNAFVMSLLEGP